MRVLITGAQGRIGRVVTRLAAEAGHELRTFDQAAAPPAEWEHLPGNLLDGAAVRRAVMGCEAIVHLAAIPNDRSGQADLVFQTNVQGTWHVLEAAAEAGVKKVVFFSSVNALGIWGGQRMADYLPVDDAHPAYPNPAYGLSKRVGEEMCASFTRRHGITTLCLRPVLVVDPDSRWMRQRPRTDNEWSRRWLSGDYYAYVHLQDVARAAVMCLDPAVEEGHGVYLLAARDNAAGLPTAEILKQDYPEVPWRGGPDYLDQPDRGLVDTSAAWKAFGWKPEHSIKELWGNSV